MPVLVQQRSGGMAQFMYGQAATAEPAFFFLSVNHMLHGFGADTLKTAA